jgi:hypothetical protein
MGPSSYSGGGCFRGLALWCCVVTSLAFRSKQFAAASAEMVSATTGTGVVATVLQKAECAALFPWVGTWKGKGEWRSGHGCGDLLSRIRGFVLKTRCGGCCPLPDGLECGRQSVHGTVGEFLLCSWGFQRSWSCDLSVQHSSVCCGTEACTV